MSKPHFLRSWLGLPVGLILLATPLAAQEVKPAQKQKAGALEIVPDDALLAIAIRNVSELMKRGDTFIERTEFKTPMRISEAYKFVTAYLGLARGLDDGGAAALFAVGDKVDLQTLVMAVPIGDLQAMAENFSLKPEDLVEGKVIDRQVREGAREFVNYARYLARRGGHVYLGPNEASVAAAVKGKRLREILPEEDSQSLAEDDILFYANPRPLKEEWKGLFGGVPPVDPSQSPEDAEALALVSAATLDLQYGLGGLRLDGGLGASVLLRFKGEKSKEILTRLQSGGKHPTALSGLPIGRVLAAYAASGDGDQSAGVARAILRYSLAHYVADTSEIISAGHRPNVVGVFGEVWQRLEGSRSALYENEHSERDGHFSLVAVLDTEHAEKFVADMTGLARFVNASGLTLDDKPEAIDAKTLAALVMDLGHDEYRVRQMATTKLGLVGRAALPALEQGIGSKDAEIQFRARALKQQILLLAAEERDNLLKRDLLSRIQPKFAYFPKVETRSGRPVDIVQMRLGIDEAPHTAELRRLLGPEWSKLRLATVGEKVVVLLGSNTALLDQAIANVRGGEQGLQADPRLTAFRKRGPAPQTLELHLTLTRAQELATSEGKPKPIKAGPASLTSLGLTIAPERVRLDFFAPFDEVKSVTKKLGW